MMKYSNVNMETTHTRSFEECISEVICEVEGMKVKAVTGDFDGMMEHMKRIDAIVYPNMADEQSEIFGNYNTISN